MKKIAILLVATLVMMMAVACGNKTSEAESAASSDKVDVLEKDEAGTIAMPEKLGTVNKLGQYKGLTVTIGDDTVTDEEVEEEIKSTLDSAVVTREVERAAKEGDTVNIDYVGKKDGVAFDGGTAEGYDLKLGSNAFIDGFEDGLIGAKAGDERVLNLTFPENYASEELAGHEAEFTVTVNSVKEEVVPELTDAWVEDYTGGEQKTVDEYRKAVRKELEEYRKLDVESAAQNELVTKVIEDSDVTVDEIAKEYFYKVQMDYYEKVVQSYGMTVDDYVTAMGEDKDEFKLELQKYAEEMAKQRLVNEAIMEAEGLELEDADYQALADAYGYSVDSLKELYGESIFENSVMSYKVGQFILENAKKQ